MARQKGRKKIFSSDKARHSHNITFPFFGKIDNSLKDDDYEYLSPLWIWEDDEWRIIRQIEQYLRWYEETASFLGKYQH